MRIHLFLASSDYRVVVICCTIRGGITLIQTDQTKSSPQISLYVSAHAMCERIIEFRSRWRSGREPMSRITTETSFVCEAFRTTMLHSTAVWS